MTSPQACRYADTLVVMRDGEVAAAGPPHAVVNEELVRKVFGIDCSVVPDPRTGTPLVLAALDDPGSRGG